MQSRPALTPALSGAELRRWYWTLAELTALARSMGVPVRGGKAALAERLAAALDGTPVPPAPAPRGHGTQLAAPVDGSTVLPSGQRCSEVLRAWFTATIGPAFRFDGPMREFVAGGAGRTLDDGVAHWHATRGTPGTEIAPQFELNRFLRARRATHPGESRAAALVAWRTHRAQPRDPATACLRCGVPGDPTDPTWAVERTEAGERRLCPDCVRRHVRDIEAKLPHDWW